jgi:hypothetical protein
VGTRAGVTAGIAVARDGSLLLSVIGGIVRLRDGA